MTPVRLEPAALRSRVKHSTTEPPLMSNPDNKDVHVNFKDEKIIFDLQQFLT